MNILAGRGQARFAMLKKRLSALSALMLLMACGVQGAHAERTTTYYHSDALGSIVAASDENGALLWRKEYAPYGAQIDSTTEQEKLAYTGKEHDDSTGLTYFGARYYDPQLARFTSVDPAGISLDNPFSFNRYAYANSNPYRFIDPDGRDPEAIFGIMMGIMHKKEDALLIQQGELAASNFRAAGGIDVGLALADGKRALENGESFEGALTTATVAVIGAVAKKKSAARGAKPFSKEKQALVDMAKADRRKGITSADMQAYKDLNKDLPDPFPTNKVRGPEAHPIGGSHSRQPHGHVGPVDHIPIVDPSP